MGTGERARTREDAGMAGKVKDAGNGHGKKAAHVKGHGEANGSPRKLPRELY